MKAIGGFGTTIDVVLVNGRLKFGQTIVLTGHCQEDNLKDNDNDDCADRHGRADCDNGKGAPDPKQDARPQGEMWIHRTQGAYGGTRGETCFLKSGSFKF